MKRLKAHGFGLVTVDQSGQADRLCPAIPLVQILPNAEFKEAMTIGISRSMA